MDGALCPPDHKTVCPYRPFTWSAVLAAARGRLDIMLHSFERAVLRFLQMKRKILQLLKLNGRERNNFSPFRGNRFLNISNKATKEPFKNNVFRICWFSSTTVMLLNKGCIFGYQGLFIIKLLLEVPFYTVDHVSPYTSDIHIVEDASFEGLLTPNIR